MYWMIVMALLLGVRHGFDLDHLATIDSITRITRTKTVGFLFSLGHGLVVITMSAILGAGLIQSHIPTWLDGFGTWISIFFLLIFGFINLWNVFHQTSLPVGIKSYLTKKISKNISNPFTIIWIGSLFAISFDTISQVSLFSLSASLLSGCWFAILLGICFMLGMMLSDGLNGLLVALLLRQASTTSRILSRGLGLTVSMFSLTIGFLGLLKAIQ